MLIADYAPTRIGVASALRDLAELCAEADDADGALAAAQSAKPDICLIGQAIPGGGVSAVRQIAAALPGTLIVFLASDQSVDQLLGALRGGAVGYVPTNCKAEQLHRIVTAVLAREAAIPRNLVLTVISGLRTLERFADDPLSAREAQILSMLRDGSSTAAIASRLSISPITVRRHISKVMSKAGANDRAELVGDLELS